MVNIERGIAREWYPAGSWARGGGDRRIAVGCARDLLTTCNILIIPYTLMMEKVESSSTSHGCRKVFIRAKCKVPGGVALLMIRSAIVAQMGQDVDIQLLGH
jgi:hypothetical protein